MNYGTMGFSAVPLPFLRFDCFERLERFEPVASFI
jgi:hypothetical protein